MILEETINRLIREIVDLLLETPGFTIKSKQNAPRPQGSYADVDIVSDTSIGWEQTEYQNRESDQDLDWTSKGYRQIMMSIGFYREGSVDNARKVRSAIIRESVQSLFLEGGVGLIRRSDVREVSETLENGWEERAQFDLFLSAVGSDADIVRSIESINLAGEYQARGLTYNFNLEVN